MTAELARGQNHPLPGGRLEILVSAGTPVIAGATLNNERGRMRDARWCATRRPRGCRAWRCPGRPPPSTGSPSIPRRCRRTCTG
ncbi:hypothetical protein [Streptomyces cacaoi]|uniref:hypothetical protein n=1 Tax=Streptomyces cacaoi TaxID=1898 RepID=UPI00374911E6